MIFRKNNEILHSINTEQDMFIIYSVIDNKLLKQKKDQHARISVKEFRKLLIKNMDNKKDWSITFTQEGWKQWAKATMSGIAYQKRGSTNRNQIIAKS